MTRQTKTPRQRAEEALAVAERAVDRLTEQEARAAAEHERLDAELAAAVRRRDHLATHPDLGPSTTTSTGDTA